MLLKIVKTILLFFESHSEFLHMFGKMVWKLFLSRKFQKSINFWIFIFSWMNTKCFARFNMSVQGFKTNCSSVLFLFCIGYHSLLFCLIWKSLRGTDQWECGKVSKLLSHWLGAKLSASVRYLQTTLWLVQF